MCREKAASWTQKVKKCSDISLSSEIRNNTDYNTYTLLLSIIEIYSFSLISFTLSKIFTSSDAVTYLCHKMAPNISLTKSLFNTKSLSQQLLIQVKPTYLYKYADHTQYDQKHHTSCTGNTTSLMHFNSASCLYANNEITFMWVISLCLSEGEIHKA